MKPKQLEMTGSTLRVTYRDVNLWDYRGTVVGRDGQFTLVRWDNLPQYTVREWWPNLRPLTL